MELCENESERELEQLSDGFIYYVPYMRSRINLPIIIE